MDGSCSRWMARRRSRTIIGLNLSTKKVLSVPGSLRETVTRIFFDEGPVKARPSLASGSTAFLEVVEDELFLGCGYLIYQANLLHELREFDETVWLGRVGYPLLGHEPPELLRRRLAPRLFGEDLGRPVWVALYKLCCLLDVAVECLHGLRVVVVVALANEHVDERVRPEEVEALEDGTRALVLLLELERRRGEVARDLSAQERLQAVGVGERDYVVVECLGGPELLLGSPAQNDGLDGVGRGHGDAAVPQVPQILNLLVRHHQPQVHLV